METIYTYKLMVKYDDDYFEAGNDTELYYILGYSSIRQKNIQEMQTVFKNCTILHAELIEIKPPKQMDKRRKKEQNEKNQDSIMRLTLALRTILSEGECNFCRETANDALKFEKEMKS